MHFNFDITLPAMIGFVSFLCVVWWRFHDTKRRIKNLHRWVIFKHHNDLMNPEWNVTSEHAMDDLLTDTNRMGVLTGHREKYDKGKYRLHP